MKTLVAFAGSIALSFDAASAWIGGAKRLSRWGCDLCERRARMSSMHASPNADPMSTGSLHGQNSCFLPLRLLDQDHYTPRIFQIAGSYPGLTRQEFFAVQSEPAAEVGQWNYDFSDPDGPQLGTVALDGSEIVAQCQDPVVIIAEHTALGIILPNEIKDPVDTIVLVDRAKNTFEERKFLVLDMPGQASLTIRAFAEKKDLPGDAEILGQIDYVQAPWLPSMAITKSGFLEADEYF